MLILFNDNVKLHYLLYEIRICNLKMPHLTYFVNSGNSLLRVWEVATVKASKIQCFVPEACSPRVTAAHASSGATSAYTMRKA